MLEDIAKTKHCCGPFPCGTKAADNGPDRLCVGSDCMAWQTPNSTNGNDLQYWMQTKRLPLEEAQEALEIYNAENPVQGYCGLCFTQK